MKTVTATIFDRDDLKIRVKLTDSSRINYSDLERGGVSLENAWLGKKWFVTELYSKWVSNGEQSCRGTYYIAYNIEYDRNFLLRTFSDCPELMAALDKKQQPEEV